MLAELPGQQPDRVGVRNEPSSDEAIEGLPEPGGHSDNDLQTGVVHTVEAGVAARCRLSGRGCREGAVQRRD